MKIQEDHITYAPGFSVKIQFLNVKKYGPHYHDSDLEIIYCLRGAVTVICAFETIRLQTGDFFTVSHRDIHSIESDDENNIIALVHLDLTSQTIPWTVLDNDIFIFEYISETPGHTLTMQHTQIVDILTLLFHLSAAGEKDPQFFCAAASKIIIILAGNFTYINFARSEYSLPQSTKDIVGNMYLYIHEHFSERVSISTFAEHAHFSKTYLANFIKTNYQLTFNEILNYVRCMWAERLLLTTELSNLEISNECGFSDSKYLYNHFKRWYGRTPVRHKEWYEEYCKTPESYEMLSDTGLKEFLTDFYCSWHREKTAAFIYE